MSLTVAGLVDKLTRLPPDAEVLGYRRIMWLESGVLLDLGQIEPNNGLTHRADLSRMPDVDYMRPDPQLVGAMHHALHEILGPDEVLLDGPPSLAEAVLEHVADHMRPDPQ